MKNNSKGSRRERERLAQRQEILTAALSLFSEKGYRNVCMHEIAELSEFAIGTLYKFFENKEALYRALLLDLAHRIHEQVRQAIDEPELEIDKLRKFIVIKGEVFQANAAVIRLYFAESQGASYNLMMGLESEIHKLHDQFLDKLAGIFEQGIRKKRFRRIADPYFLAVAIDSITNAFFSLWLEDSKKHPYPEDPDEILNIFSKGLVI